MFKILETNNKNPVRFPVVPGVKLSTGHIVKIVEYNNHLAIDLCDGYNAFGISGNRWSGEKELVLTKNIKIYPQRMIVTTNKYDRKNKINSCDSLYCNSKGMLTSKKPFEGAIVLAKVISCEKNQIVILWI